MKKITFVEAKQAWDKYSEHLCLMCDEEITLGQFFSQTCETCKNLTVLNVPLSACVNCKGHDLWEPKEKVKERMNEKNDERKKYYLERWSDTTQVIKRDDAIQIIRKDDEKVVAYFPTHDTEKETIESVRLAKLLCNLLNKEEE